MKRKLILLERKFRPWFFRYQEEVYMWMFSATMLVAAFMLFVIGSAW